MDVDLRWGGDPNIVLGVTALVASIPIQLKDLQVFTVARVIFQLADEIPCISAVVVALLAEVHVSLLKIQNQMHFSLSLSDLSMANF